MELVCIELPRGPRVRDVAVDYEGLGVDDVQREQDRERGGAGGRPEPVARADAGDPRREEHERDAQPDADRRCPQARHSEAEGPFVQRPQGRITLAGGLLQPLAVDDPDDAPPVADQLGRLQGAGDDRHRLAAHAEHLRHELLRQRKRVGPCPVVRHQQPSAQPLFHRVQGVAGDELFGAA